jgi:hypothetical protein
MLRTANTGMGGVVTLAPNRGRGTLTYMSSGRIMQGDWVVTRETLAP